MLSTPLTSSRLSISFPEQIGKRAMRKSRLRPWPIPIPSLRLKKISPSSARVGAKPLPSCFLLKRWTSCWHHHKCMRITRMSSPELPRPLSEGSQYALARPLLFAEERLPLHDVPMLSLCQCHSHTCANPSASSPNPFLGNESCSASGKFLTDRTDAHTLSSSSFLLCSHGAREYDEACPNTCSFQGAYPPM